MLRLWQHFRMLLKIPSFLLISLYLHCMTPVDKECGNYPELYKQDDSWLFYNLAKFTQFNTWKIEGRTAKYIFTGDSIIDRWNALGEADGGYRWMTDANYTPTANTAIYGATSCDLIERESSNVSAFKPEYIVTDGGGNDILFRVNTQIVIRNVDSYIEILRRANPDAKIVYLLIPPSFIDFANYEKVSVNSSIKNTILNMSNACYVDLSGEIAENGIDGGALKKEFSADGDKIHFSFNVYPILKAKIDSAFNNLPINGAECSKITR